MNRFVKVAQSIVLGTKTQITLPAIVQIVKIAKKRFFSIDFAPKPRNLIFSQIISRKFSLVTFYSQCVSRDDSEPVIPTTCNLSSLHANKRSPVHPERQRLSASYDEPLPDVEFRTVDQHRPLCRIKHFVQNSPNREASILFTEISGDQNIITNVFLDDVTSVCFIGRIDPGDDVLELVNQDDSSSSTLVSRFQNPDIHYSVHVQLLPIFANFFENVARGEKIFLEKKSHFFDKFIHFLFLGTKTLVL